MKFHEGLIFQGAHFFIGKANLSGMLKTEQTKSGFNSDLKEFVQSLMKKIMNDIDKNSKLPQSELYSLINLLKFMPEFQQQEIFQPISATPTKNQHPKTLSPEVIAQIKRDFLGVEE